MDCRGAMPHFGWLSVSVLLPAVLLYRLSVNNCGMPAFRTRVDTGPVEGVAATPQGRVPGDRNAGCRQSGSGTAAHIGNRFGADAFTCDGRGIWRVYTFILQFAR